jgi:hypothetical protein
MAGVSIKEIQEAAGHKTITMSARYSHLSPEHKQSVVERIARTAQASPRHRGTQQEPKQGTKQKRPLGLSSRLGCKPF